MWMSDINHLGIVFRGLIGDLGAFRQEDDLPCSCGLRTVAKANGEGTLRDDERFVVRDDPLVLLALPPVAVEADAHAVAVRGVQDVANEDLAIRILIEPRILACEM